MEAHAPYSTAEIPSDRREVVASAAAWLAEQGFQIVCGPLPDGKTKDLLACWRSESGSVFELTLVAQVTWATCACTERVGVRSFDCFSWTDVEELRHVQWLLLQNRQYRQARATSATGQSTGSPAEAAPAPGASPQGFAPA